MNPTVWIVLGWACLVAIAIVWLWQRQRQRRIEERIYDQSPASMDTNWDESQSTLRRWLFLAGFRSENAPEMFVAITLGAAIAGGTAAFLFWQSDAYARGLDALQQFPGGVGEVFLPVFYVAPWTIALLLVAAPWIVVQRARRARVAAIENELPVTLELLAALTEAGLGIDAVLGKLLDSQLEESPLSRELRFFQLDLLSGRRRVSCFRRLAQRIDVAAVSIFVSAIVQAEQVGAGIAQVLRQQANDLRDRRREDAMAMAMSLPVKRLFPLVICFLPGIFVAALGPTAYQFFQHIDTVLRLQSFGGGP